MTIIGVLLSFRGLAQEALLDVSDQLYSVACIVYFEDFREFCIQSRQMCVKSTVIFLCLRVLECRKIRNLVSGKSFKKINLRSNGVMNCKHNYIIT